MKRWLLNLVLAGLVTFFAVRIAGTWSQAEGLGEMAAEGTLPSVRAVPVPGARRLAPKADYEVIARRNLFARERAAVEVVTAVVNPKSAEGSQFAKELVLHGVLIREKEGKTALVEAGAKAKGVKAAKWVRPGDRLDQVLVVGIERDRIYVQENGQTFEVRLSRRRGGGPRAKPLAAVAPTVVVSGKAEGAPADAPPESQEPPAVEADGAPPPEPDSAR